MPETSGPGELYFIAGAMVLILIICTVAVYAFFRQLKRERSRNADGPSRSTADPAGATDGQATHDTAGEEE